ncbi:hypothetical protein SETIT_8G212200v2 [Setaria italica]|uniref:Uncharacterized protein n=1 Tax=Setaria italica TaxID=4555 RepID=A0A368SA42_SETIT|nr:hypothetical protein SETIT_8G212200v2 [Setaria italica]
MLCAAARRWGRGFALPPAEDTPRRTVNGPQAARPSMAPHVDEPPSREAPMFPRSSHVSSICSCRTWYSEAACSSRWLRPPLADPVL